MRLAGFLRSCIPKAGRCHPEVSRNHKQDPEPGEGDGAEGPSRARSTSPKAPWALALPYKRSKLKAITAMPERRPMRLSWPRP